MMRASGVPSLLGIWPIRIVLHLGLHILVFDLGGVDHFAVEGNVLDYVVVGDKSGSGGASVILSGL